MAANEHNRFRDRAIQVRIQSYTAAAHALVGMSLALSEDKPPVLLRTLIAKLDGREGAEMALKTWETLRRVASSVSGTQHGQLPLDDQAKVVDALLDHLALLAEPFAGLPR